MRIKIIAMLAALVMVSACTTKNADVDGSVSGSTVGTESMGDLNFGPRADMTPAQVLEAEVGDRVFFGYDSSEVSGDAQKTLERQALFLKQNPSLTVTIEGHCDERGTREYNLALGERRATAVRNYLLALGVDASRVQTVSYGKERPAVLGSDTASWAQNRRGVMTVN